MPVALIAGAFGQGNPGDEALLDAHLRVVHAAGWDAMVTTSDPTHLDAGASPRAVAPRGWAAADACRRADAIVVGGGTIFGRLHPSTGRRPGDLLRRTAALATAARVLDRPIAFSGVGASPVEGAHDRALVRATVRMTDLLVLRDEESAAVLQSTGAPAPFRVGADPAWTVVDEVPEPTRDIDLVIVMSHLAATRGLVGWLVATVNALPEAATVAVVPWQGTNPHDTGLAGALAKLLRGRAQVLDAPIDLTDGTAMMARARVALCLRFHGAMACAMAGTPFVAIGHEPKLQALARRLHAQCVPPSCTPTELVDALRRARAAGPVSSSAIDLERKRADEGMQLLRLLLSGGATYEDASVPALALVPGEL